MLSLLNINFNWIIAIAILGDQFVSSNGYCKEFSIDPTDEGSLQRLTDFIQNQTSGISSIDTDVHRHEKNTTVLHYTQNSATTESNHLTTTISANASYDAPRFTFKDANHSDYILYNGTVPDMTSFTVCVWIRCTSSWSGNQAIVSYCVPGDKSCNTFVIWLKNGKIKVSFRSQQHNSTSAYGNGNNYRNRTHICIVKSGASLRLHINASKHDFNETAPKTLRGGGFLILGQNLDGGKNESTPVPRDPHQGFHGDIGGFQLWNQSLTDRMIGGLYQYGECLYHDRDGLIVTLNKSNSAVKGNTTADWSPTCQ